MTKQDSQIPWNDIGGPLAELLRYEREIGHYEHASYQLLSTLVHGDGSAAWGQYLLTGQHFGSVVDQVLSICRRELAKPNEALAKIRKLVSSICCKDARTADSFLDGYLPARPRLPGPIRERLDELVFEGHRATPLSAAALAVELQGLNPDASGDDVEAEICHHWYEQVLHGDLDEAAARSIPAQIRAARKKLLSHLRQFGPELQTTEEVKADLPTLHARYRRVFVSRRIPELTELVTAAERAGLRVEVEQVEAFLQHHAKDEALRRLEGLASWMKVVNHQNHDGVVLTPMLTDHLAGPGSFESLLGELDRLRAETRRGQFRSDDALQKELEFIRFSTEYQWQQGDAGHKSEDYQRFQALPDLPPPSEGAFTLNGEHIIHAKRVAYEAVELLKFLGQFRTHTTRPIVVVGNDRYGRQWVVEPLEDHLKHGFLLRYDRSPSHKSMRLKVRHELPGNLRLGFPRDFVGQINEQMPHVVIVDSCSPRGDQDMMQFSRATRDYVNWFMVFNDLRAQGDGRRYEAASGLSADHFAELRKWHEYERVKRQLRDWVTPGDTYAVAHWAPVSYDAVLLGDFKVDRQEPDLGCDRPIVVVANPAFYGTDIDQLPQALRETRPYFFDGPERYVTERLAYGFGPHGFETRIEGTTTDTFVAEVQRCIKVKIDRIVNGEET